MRKIVVRVVVLLFALATFGAMSIGWSTPQEPGLGSSGNTYREGYMDGYDDGYSAGLAAADTGNTNQPTCCGGSG